MHLFVAILKHTALVRHGEQAANTLSFVGFS